jgi:hypothetical protein|tara:strand:- start:16 stop:723 length:708 start_codon:yes stop_codon:yes gene_type:complete
MSQHRKNISGIVLFQNQPLSNVHIMNKNTQIGTISNDNGLFKIPIKENDSLFISHINYKEIFIIVTNKHTSSLNLKIILDEKIEILNEITIGNQKSIFYVDKDILTSGAKISAKSLNLPFAGTKKEENKSVVKIRSGAVVSLDNLINLLNGNKKRERILKKITIEDKELAKIRNHFTDDFFVSTLKIKKENINSFLEFCKNKHIISAYNSKNQIAFMTTIIRHSKSFLYTIENKN